MSSAGPPRATYRLQFNRQFTFSKAARLVPYLDRLGISHVYASPCLKARAGSTHGYDIIDHAALNPEIGGREEFERFVDILHRHGMGLILDIVPNHMGIANGENAWWQDVLENGLASPWSGYFDIDWHPGRETLRSKVHLPVLGEHYGACLESGGLRLELAPLRGEFVVRYDGQRFPLDPETYPEILSRDLERLAALGAKESHLMTEWHALVAGFDELRVLRSLPVERSRAAAGCKQRLALLCDGSAAAKVYLAEQLTQLNGTPDNPESFAGIHRLLEQQSFRLAYWRVAADEINYRRFFDINDLACLRQENPDVFGATHRLVLALVADGSVDGLRIDHPDGLQDPRGYFRRLQEEVARFRHPVPDAAGENPAGLYLVIEKILAGYEHLREDWPVAGTTGYEFANLVTGLLVHAPAERELTRCYARFIGRSIDFDDLLYQSKRQVIRTQMSSELAMLAKRLDTIAEMDLHTRDYTFNDLREALVEVVARFPVYRTYIARDRISQEDVRFVDWAIAQAQKNCSRTTEKSVFDFLREVLLLRHCRGGSEEYCGQVLQFTLRLQQYTAPILAKALEDTACYAYNRLLCLNEVGADPTRFGVSVAAFHHANQQRLRHWPQSLIATATHDSKRGEDLRARLAVISEQVPEWRRKIALWHRWNRGKKRALDGEAAPDRNDEYFIYQTLVGAWPLETLDDAGMARFRERLRSYLLKALREAKVHSSWLNPDPAYEGATIDFLEKLLDAAKGRRFLDDFLPFQRRMAWFGLFNSLSQVLLKLTCPGVPDCYQGSELWNFDLVDPDNRRPVDFSLRQQRLKLLSRKGGGADGSEEGIATNLADGTLKMDVIRTALTLRRHLPQLFATGEYQALECLGDRSDHLVAFGRSQGETTVIVLAGRWFARLMGNRESLPTGPAVWGNTRIALPRNLAGQVLVELLTHRHREILPLVTATTVELDAGEVFQHLPVALLSTERLTR